MLKYSSDNENLISFVDASLIYLAQKKNIKDIISFDQHFDGKLNRIHDLI